MRACGACAPEKTSHARRPCTGGKCAARAWAAYRSSGGAITTASRTFAPVANGALAKRPVSWRRLAHCTHTLRGRAPSVRSTTLVGAKIAKCAVENMTLMMGKRIHVASNSNSNGNSNSNINDNSNSNTKTNRSTNTAFGDAIKAESD